MGILKIVLRATLLPLTTVFANESENLQLSEQGWMADLRGQRNIDRINTLMTDDCTVDSTGLPGTTDKETTNAVVMAYKAAMPDLMVTTDEAHASSSKVFFT